MAPILPETRITLDYLPYACDFDPQETDRLVVGGGGGANRSGVANRITAIDASGKDELRLYGEIDLSRDEDSVNTLAVGQKKPAGAGKPPSTLVYAGINSSPADLEKGKNEHFRVFSLSGPSSSSGKSLSEKDADKTKQTAGAKFVEASRTALFKHGEGDKDTYQRVMRVSQAFPEKPGHVQLGAVATGFAKQSQIALFEISNNTTPKPKGVLELSKEVTDLDVIQLSDDAFQVAYCDDEALYVINVTKAGGITGPDLMYEMKDDGTGIIPILRSIRYLAPGLIMALSNLPRQTGSIMSGIRLPAKEGDEARLAVGAKLPRSFSRSTALTVKNVNPPSMPGAAIGDTQFVVAVASLQSLSVWTLEHRTHGSIGLLVDLLCLTDIKDAHPLNVTAIALSGFVPAVRGPGETEALPTMKLASVSMNNTVAVHSIPLKRISDKSSPPRKNGPPRAARYAVAIASFRPGFRRMLTMVFLVVMLIASITAVFVNSGLVGSQSELLRALEPRRRAPPVESAPIVEKPTPEVLTPGNFLKGLLPEISSIQKDDVYVVWEDDVIVEASSADGNDGETRTTDAEAEVETAASRIQAAVHNEEVHGPAKSWEQLSSEQKELWKQKLEKAGHWTAGMGESVFNGMLFRELAEKVPEAVRDEL